MTDDFKFPELDPVDELLWILLRSYEDEKRERDPDDPILELMWEGIELYAKHNGIDNITMIT